jgi:hypothetical protein
MATTTPNYGWPVPTSTDLVKDGATAIEALGDAIDATVFGLPPSGMTLVKTQTIGSAVASVTVTGAFSATYDNYKIILAGGANSVGSVIIGMQLGATNTGYYWGTAAGNYGSATGDFRNGSNVSSWGRAGIGQTTGLQMDLNIYNPFNAIVTTMSQTYLSAETGGVSGAGGGYLTGTTSYTAFTLTPSSGTMTNGTIRVYGYKN